MINFEEIESIINYKFKTKEYLLRAFTHSSLSTDNNERLEFLGDSVLQIIVSDYLFRQSKLDEGVLSKYRAKIVCEDNLYKTINSLNLQKYLMVGDSFKGEPSKAMCADLCESIIGAIYLDSGDIECSKNFVFKYIDLSMQLITDNKSALQELVQENGKTTQSIKYNTIENNSNNCLEFISVVYIDDENYGQGIGRTKKQAEQNAAKIALEKLKSGEK